MLDGVEGDDFLEKLEAAIASRGRGEVGDWCPTRPRDDADQKNARYDSAFDAIEHEERCEYASAEYPEPHCGTAHYS